VRKRVNEGPSLPALTILKYLGKDYAMFRICRLDELERFLLRIEYCSGGVLEGFEVCDINLGDQFLRPERVRFGTDIILLGDPCHF
jgi:hypothetical protein